MQTSDSEDSKRMKQCKGWKKHIGEDPGGCVSVSDWLSKRVTTGVVFTYHLMQKPLVRRKNGNPWCLLMPAIYIVALIQ